MRALICIAALLCLAAAPARLVPQVERLGGGLVRVSVKAPAGADLFEVVNALAAAHACPRSRVEAGFWATHVFAIDQAGAFRPVREGRCIVRPPVDPEGETVLIDTSPPDNSAALKVLAASHVEDLGGGLYRLTFVLPGADEPMSASSDFEAAEDAFCDFKGVAAAPTSGRLTVSGLKAGRLEQTLTLSAEIACDPDVMVKRYKSRK